MVGSAVASQPGPRHLAITARTSIDVAVRGCEVGGDLSAVGADLHCVWCVVDAGVHAKHSPMAYVVGDVGDRCGGGNYLPSGAHGVLWMPGG